MPDPSRDAYRPDIDGLRAIAVLAVIAFHAMPAIAPGGFAGVDVFFVISGFLITGHIRSDIAAGAFTIRRFYARRIRRIFPALIVVLLACLAFGWLVLLPNEYDQVGQHVAAGGGFVVNLVLWREAGYFDIAAASKPLLHLWSLGIEEQFYVVWPLLLVLVTRLRRSPIWVIAAMFALSFALNVMTVERDPVTAFFSPTTRMWELAAGGLLVFVAVPRYRGACSLVGLALIAASIAVLRDDRAFPGWWAVLPVTGTALVIAGGANRWLGWLAPVGLISYPLYLWHWPALVFARLIELGEPPLAVRGAIVVASALAAWLTYRFVEKPLRRRAAIAGLAIAMAAIVGAGLAVHAARGVPDRMPEPLRAIASADYDFRTDARADRCWLSQTAPIDGFAPECTDAGATVVVWGDSHAARLIPGIRATTQRPLAQYTRSTCPPILDQGFATCIASNAVVIAKIRAARPALVILFAYWNQYIGSGADDPVLAGLVRTVRAVHDAGVPTVVVVGPAPQWVEALPRVLLAAVWRDPAHRLPDRTRLGLRRDVAALDARMAAAFGGEYVSAWRTFCDERGCVTSSADGIFSWDYGHLTTPGATFLARALAPYLAPSHRDAAVDHALP